MYTYIKMQASKYKKIILQVKFPLLPGSVSTASSTCGKPNCVCVQGQRHGPFYYLTSNLAPGHVLKFLLKDSAQQQSAKEGVRHYQAHWERLEELSQINAELLRRGEPLAPQP